MLLIYFFLVFVNMQIFWFNQCYFFFTLLLFVFNSDKGTFYIDTCFSFTQMFLYGNEVQLFIFEFLLLLAVYLIFSNLLAAVIAVCIFNKVKKHELFVMPKYFRLFSIFKLITFTSFQMLQSFYCYAVKENISNKTLIDKRFLM